MRRFFDPEGLLWKPLGFLGELVTLSLLWALCSIPLVTLGPASAALYDTTVHVMRRREGTPFARFFSTFRRELKQGILSTLLWAAILGAIALVLWAALRLFPGFAGRGALVSLLELLLGFFALGVLCWVWPTLSRFTLSFGALQSVSLRLALGHSLRSAAMALVCGAALVLSLRYVFSLFVVPGAAAFLCSYLIEPVFRQYEDAQSSGEEENEKTDG